MPRHLTSNPSHRRDVGDRLPAGSVTVIVQIATVRESGRRDIDVDALESLDGRPVLNPNPVLEDVAEPRAHGGGNGAIRRPRLVHRPAADKRRGRPGARPGPLPWASSGTLRLSFSAPGSSRGVPRYPQVSRCRRLDVFPASTTRREKTMNTIQQWFQREGLTRPRHSRLLAGVIAGLGRRVGIDPWPARLLFVLLALALHGGLILLYIILWILMPLDETQPATLWPPEPPVSPTP
jgi:phage shock protein C